MRIKNGSQVGAGSTDASYRNEEDWGRRASFRTNPEFPTGNTAFGKLRSLLWDVQQQPLPRLTGDCLTSGGAPESLG